nr:hypothetical protein 5 [Desulfobacteraceae bacterium]
MNNIIPFNYNSHRIRVIRDKNGQPWWIAKEICEILDLSNVSMVVQSLDDDERSKFNLGRQGDAWLINEPGLYSLILKSRKPEAKKFKRWITHEVLPAIRKNGKYEVGNLSEIDLIIRSAKALKTIELKQIEHDKRLASLEAKSHHNSGQTGYWTITAWCRLNNLKISLDEAMKKGRDAARLSNQWGVEIGKVPDERFGVVNSYREDILEEIFYPAEECK